MNLGFPGVGGAGVSAHHLPHGLVTFLFTDIEGSTRLAQVLGSGYRTVLIAHRRVLRRVLAEYGGTPVSVEGDELFVAFADATQALAACSAAQRALANHQWPSAAARPQVRMGLHTGDAEPVGTEYTSAEVHRAARVAAAAHGGQVLCSAATAAAAGLPLRAAEQGTDWLLDLGLHRLRGFDGRERLYQLVSPGLVARFPRPRTQADAPHNLPAALTTFVGRERECAELTGLLHTQRLVTVVGTGGAGKTRLAVQTAGELADGYPDGVWFVDLAGVAEPGLVATAVATVLGLRPEPGRELRETLVEYVASRRMLILLDTCDAHQRTAGQLIGALVAAGPALRVLATSREPVGAPGEVVWRIPPLSLAPAPDGGPSEAVRFLLNRAQAALGALATVPEASRSRHWPVVPLARLPRGALTGTPVARTIPATRTVPAPRPAPAPLVGAAADPAAVFGSEVDLAELDRVAHRLEGLPLAMELAAARLRVLTPAQLAARLGDVIGTLDAGRGGNRPVDRHATLHATVDWSYRTLGARSGRLLRWLSVFAGPVDLTTVQWLVGEDPLDSLAVLVDKSLLQAEPTMSGMTYRLLDPIRSYAGRLLTQAQEEQPARDRHLAWAAYALRQAQLGPDGEPATLSLYAIDPIAVELRAGLSWAASRGSGRTGLALMLGMDQWWRERGLAREGRQWLTRLYARLADSGEVTPDAELAAAYHVHSLNAGADGDHEEELRYSQLAEQAARAAGSPGLLVRVLAGRGSALTDLGERDEAERGCRELIDTAVRSGAGPDALFAVYCLAQLLWLRGALDEAAELLATARTMEAARPPIRGRRTVDMLLGMVALARGDLVAAHEYLVVALRARMGYGFHSRACESVAAFAVRCALGGEPVTAARLFGAADTIRARLRHNPGLYVSYWSDQQARLRTSPGRPGLRRRVRPGR